MPTAIPTYHPTTGKPSVPPTVEPTYLPTFVNSVSPSAEPSEEPTFQFIPTFNPTQSPTVYNSSLANHSLPVLELQSILTVTHIYLTPSIVFNKAAQLVICQAIDETIGIAVGSTSFVIDSSYNIPVHMEKEEVSVMVQRAGEAGGVRLAARAPSAAPTAAFSYHVMKVQVRNLKFQLTFVIPFSKYCYCYRLSLELLPYLRGMPSTSLLKRTL